MKPHLTHLEWHADAIGIPAGHRLIIKPDPVEEKTKSGIYKPQEVQSMEQRAATTGTILAIGKDAWYDKRSPWAEVGNRILFSQYASVRYYIDTEELWIINDEDVLVVLESVKESKAARG